MRKPNFFIVGAPKCGTTAMYEYLSQHPDIYMGPVKEPHFFGADLCWEFRPKSEAEYLGLFAGAVNERAIGEASTWYLYSKAAAREIKGFNPGAKIIVMLRNPVDMLASLHSELVYSDTEDVQDFETALSLQDARAKGYCIPRHCRHDYMLQYYEVASYSLQLERYYTAFGRDKLHVIIYDDFAKDTLGVYRAVLEFLEVETSFVPEFNIVNSNKVARRAWLRDVLRSCYTDFPLIRAPIQWVVPPGVRHCLRDLVRSAYTSHERRAPMSYTLRQQLREEFRPEVERLSALIGRDLTGWCVD